jgi:UDP-N-acetylbacillosamine N-acetyltransferase
MKKELAIFGTGAHARKVYQCARAMGYTVIAFVDENPAAYAPVDGIPVVLPSALHAPVNTKAEMFVAIGNPVARQRLMDQLAAQGWHFPALIHPKAYVAPDAHLADGALVAATAVVETGARVGRGAIIDVGVIVDHDCRIDAFCHLRPGNVLLPGTEVGCNTPNL